MIRYLSHYFFLPSSLTKVLVIFFIPLLLFLAALPLCFNKLLESCMTDYWPARMGCVATYLKNCEKWISLTSNTNLLITSWPTNQLTPLNGVLLENPKVSHLIKKFTALLGTSKKSHLSYLKSVHSRASYTPRPTCWRSFLMCLPPMPSTRVVNK